VTSELDALQAALAGEHACVYAYGLAGGLVAVDAKGHIATGYQAHRQRRDEIEGLISRRGSEPEAALPAYATPFPVHDDATARALLAHVEHRLAAVYGDVVAKATTAELRVYAARALAEAATAAVSFGQPLTPFPGMS
jgi:Domain of unknown function (DUF4439)